MFSSGILIVFIYVYSGEKKLLMAHQEKVRHCYQGIYAAPLGGAPLIYQFLFMFILVFYFSVFLFLLKFAIFFENVNIFLTHKMY